MQEIEKKFKVGDLVVLKSGSPKMTVTKVIISAKYEVFLGTYTCSWFVDTNLIFEDFNQDSLDLFIQ